MSDPLPVEIIQPRRTVANLIVRLLGTVGHLAFRVFALMLLLRGAHERVTPAIPALSYWDTALIMLAVSFLWPIQDNGLWTISRRPERRHQS